MNPPRKILFILIMASIFLSGCIAPAPVKATHSDLHREVNPNIADDDLSNLVNGNNAFAFDLYQSLSSGEGNAVFSPYSISLALAMTYAGARNTTESQIAETLHFTLPQERLHPAFNKLDLALNRESKPQSNDGQPLQLDIVNVLWAEQSYTFLQSFLDLLASNYGTG